MEKFTISKKDGNKISCIKEIPEKAKGIVLCVHGFSSSKECPTFQVLLEKLPSAGYGMIGIDLPGHGTEESLQELLRIPGAIDSIEAAEQYALSRHPGLPVFYFASSFGAYLTGLYISTREHQGRKAFFRSAAVNMPSVIVKDDPDEEEKRQFEELEEKGYYDTAMDEHRPVRITKEFYEDLKTADLFALFDASRFGENEVAMAHGAKDEVIDPAQAKAFAARFQLPLTVFEGEGHSLAEHPDTPGQVIGLAIAFYDAGQTEKTAQEIRNIGTEQIRRIEYYEALLKDVTEMLKAAEHKDMPSSGHLQSLPSKIRELDQYYGSDAWRQDYASDEAGLLPKDLPRGVLSEDGIYQVLEQYRELLSDDRAISP